MQVRVANRPFFGKSDTIQLTLQRSKMSKRQKVRDEPIDFFLNFREATMLCSLLSWAAWYDKEGKYG